MHNIIYPIKDTTLYSKYPDVNTGLDEILEIRKEISSSLYFFRGRWDSSSFYDRYDYIITASMASDSESFFAVAENINEIPSQSSYWESFEPSSSNENSRILIKFDLTDFQAEASASASVVYLNLFTAIAREIPIEYILEVAPITGSWQMGIGNFTDKLTSGGATWTRRTSEITWDGEGGDTGSQLVTQSFNFVPTDIRMDVTTIFNYWSSSNNEGFLIKRPDDHESGIIKYGSLSFYSMDTHTVYVPTLEIAYDDHIYDTSSFLIWNVNVYETTSSTSLNIDSALLKYETTTSASLNMLSASLTSSQTFLISGGLDYEFGGNIYLTESVSQSATLTGTVTGYSRALGSMTASITSITGTGSYDRWYVNLPTGEAAGYRNQIFTIGSDLAYTTGQIIVITGSSEVSMSGVVVDYNLSGLMTASIYAVHGTGSIVNGYVNLAAGEEIGHSVTGSVSGSLISGSISVSMRGLQQEYKFNSDIRFRINTIQSYTTKTFYEEWRIGKVFYVSDTIYYSIRDAYSDRIIIPFSDYTKVSLDEIGHYFDISLSGFMPERFYKILFKVTINDAIQYFDDDNQFKVVK